MTKNPAGDDLYETFEAVKSYVDGSFDATHDAIREIEKRLTELEARPEFSDAGIWVHDKTYRVGNGVSESGSFWIAKRDTAFGEKPGNSDAWRLVVKKGRDARER